MWSDDDPHSLFTLFCPPATLGSTALTQLDRDLSVISSLASEVVLGACRLFMQSEYCPAKPGRMKGTLGSLVRNQELIDRTLKDFFARCADLEKR